MMSSLGEPDRLAGGEPACPAQPAGQRQRGDRPDPVDPGGEHLGAGQVPGVVQHLAARHLRAGFQAGEHVQGGGGLQLPGRGQCVGRWR
ncbi:MAG TPA: hypothetical protein VI365_24300 [Trebonia sp.]